MCRELSGGLDRILLPPYYRWHCWPPGKFALILPRHHGDILFRQCPGRWGRRVGERIKALTLPQ
jgi:hypothetical protein